MAWEEELASRPVLALEIIAKDLRQLRPERYHTRGSLGLQPPPVIRPDRHRLSIETHVIKFHPVSFRLAASGEQEESHHGKREGRPVLRRLVTLRRLEQQGGLMRLQPASFGRRADGLLQQCADGVEPRSDIVLTRSSAIDAGEGVQEVANAPFAHRSAAAIGPATQMRDKAADLLNGDGTESQAPRLGYVPSAISINTPPAAPCLALTGST